MQKWWSIVFGLVLGAIFLASVISPWAGWWLPPNISSYGGGVDFLFFVILAFTGFFFVLTEVILVYVMYRYAAVPGRRSDYLHGNHRLEMAWTVVPALILLYIAFAQIGTWEEIKYQSRMPKPNQVFQVTARQWEWRMRYFAEGKKGSYVHAPEREREWAESPQIDDLHLVNEVHTWKDANVKLYLKTQDVIHSFFLPNLRLKQDALPGKTIPMWFKVNHSNTRFDPNSEHGCTEPSDVTDAWELACAELCGARHYAMRGRLYVHENQADYENWLEFALKKQNSRQPEEKSSPVASNP